MKIEGKKTEPEFKPVQVTFTFESQLELDVIGSIFNSATIAQKIGELIGGPAKFYECFKKVGANIERFPQMFKNL